MYDEELVFTKRENALVAADILMDEGYAILLTREEQFTVLNFKRTFPDSDRNQVVFMLRDQFEEEFF